MLRWDDGFRLLMADSVEEAQTIAHPSGPRQVGVVDEDDMLTVYLIAPGGEVQMTHNSDHWGVPAWYENEEVTDAND
jgi:hypothetical protein